MQLHLFMLYVDIFTLWQQAMWKICTNPTRLQRGTIHKFFFLCFKDYIFCIAYIYKKKMFMLYTCYNYYLLSYYCLHFWLKCMIKMQKNIVECTRKCASVYVKTYFNLCKLLCVAGFCVCWRVFLSSTGDEEETVYKQKKTCKVS